VLWRVGCSVCLPDPCLADVPDPRDPRGIRYSMTSLLMASAAATLAGARSFTAIGEWVADAPPLVMAALGIRRDPLTGRFCPLDEATIRRDAGGSGRRRAGRGGRLVAGRPGGGR
jgi:hypothetical protein